MAKGISVPVTATGLDASISNAVKKVGAINIPVNVDPSAFKNLAQPLGRVSGLATEFEKSIAASNARVLAFGASVGIINGVQNAFASLLQTGIQVQKTLAEIAAISGQSGEALSKFGDSLFEIGKLTGQSFQVAAQAALEFSRQGLSVEETLKRTQDALTLTRFTTLNAAEAVDVLTAAANSFADTGITTTEILNKLVAVDTKFAVSAEDLANGLARAGSIAQEVGVSFDELNAAITIAQERTARGGSVIGNALKTIFTRLRSDETVQALRSIGVESLNAQGGLKGAIPLLEEVAQKLQGLSEGERVQILEAIASKYNINILSAILTDLSDANKKFGQVVGISAGAGNQAYERQIELNKALAAQINVTTVSVEQLFNKLAEIGVTESLGNLLKFVNGLLDGINKILDSESTGGNIARGLIKGISDVFFTIGLPLIGAIFIKLTKDIAQFGVESLKTILGINQQVRERQALEQAVVNTLIRDQEIMATILSLSGSRAKQEEYLLSVYNRQLAALQQVQSIAAGVAPALQAAGLSATSGTIKRRAAEGYLPAAEARDVRRGVGGASPSSKVVEIPNFSFGGGKRGTMVANTSEYIVPNYAGGNGTAIFNQDMVKEYGLPPGAKKITASGGFVPASGFVPNFVNFNVKRPQVNPTDAEKVKKGGIDYINLVGTEPSAYLTLAKDAGGTMIGRFSELQETAKGKIENVFGKNKILPSATVQGQENVVVKQIQNSYNTEKGVVNPNLNNAGTLVGKIFDYKKAIKKKDGPAADKIIKDISFGLIPETSGVLDQEIRQKFEEKIKTQVERDQSPVFAAGTILENSLFASIEQKALDDNNRTWDLPAQISPAFKKAFGISDKVKFAEVKLGKTEKSMSSFLGKHVMSPSGTNASRGYIPNFAEDEEDEEGEDGGKKPKKAKKINRKKYFGSRAIVSAEGIAGMLVPDESNQAAMTDYLRKNPWGFQTKEDIYLNDADKSLITNVRYNTYGLKEGAFEGERLKKSGSQTLIEADVEKVGIEIAKKWAAKYSDEYAKKMPGGPAKANFDSEFIGRSFLASEGAVSAISTLGGGIFESSIRAALDTQVGQRIEKAKKEDSNNRLDFPVNPFLKELFGITGGEQFVDAKISGNPGSTGRKLADQIVAAGLYRPVKTIKTAAAEGYIPNFAGKYFYDPNLIAKEDDVVKGEDGKDVKNATLKKALASRKRINVLIGPVGSGKTTFAQASGGTFLRKPSDVDLADEITILQTSHTSTKTGGISDNMRQILDAATGQVSYLDVSDEVISERRKVRSAQAEAGQIVGDTRSTKQIVSGDQFAEKKSPTFIQAVQEYLKTKGKTLNMIKGSEGYIPNFAPADPLSSLATTKQFKNDSSSSAGLEESINTAAKNAYKPFSKRKNITAGVSKNLVGNEAGTKKFRDALNSGIPVADFIGFQAATVGAPRPNISGKPEDLEKDLASLRFFNKDINGPRPALRAVTTNPDDSEVLAPASQFYDLKTAIGFAKAATVSLTQTPVGRKAAEGYVPNFADLFVDYDYTIFREQVGKAADFNAQKALIKNIREDQMTEQERQARDAQMKLLTPFGQKLLQSKKPFKLATARWNDYQSGIESSLKGLGFNVNGIFALGREFSEEQYKVDNPKFAEEMKKPEGERNTRVKPRIEPSAAQKKALFFKERAPQIATGDIDFVDNDAANLQAVKSLMPKINTFTPDQYMAKLLAPQEVKGAKASLGFVPNFVENEPLKEAINREVAAGVSPARVRVTQDNRLQNSKNPQGLAVINTRDEPNGKIPNNFRKRVARQEAASTGFVPNFADKIQSPSDIRRAEDRAVKQGRASYLSDKPSGATPDEGVKVKTEAELDKFSESVSKAAEAANKGSEAADKQAKSTSSLDATILKSTAVFGALTSASYILQETLAKTDSGILLFTKGLTDAAQKASLGLTLGEGFKPVLEVLGDKLPGAMGRFTTQLSGAVPVIGAVSGAFFGLAQFLDELTTKDKRTGEQRADKFIENAQGLDTKGSIDAVEKRIQELDNRSPIADLSRRRETARVVTSTMFGGAGSGGFGYQGGPMTEAEKKEEEESQKALGERIKLEEFLKKLKEKAAAEQGRAASQQQKENEEVRKRISLSESLASINEAFAAGQNKNLIDRASKQANLIKLSYKLTESQKAEQELQQKLQGIENQRLDLRNELFNRALNEIANSSKLANVDQQSVKNLVERVKNGEKIENLQTEFLKLGAQGALVAEEVLKKTGSTLVIENGKLDTQRRTTEQIERANIALTNQLKIEELRSRILDDNFKANRDIEESILRSTRTLDEAKLKTPISILENQIATQPFATREQEYELARLKDQFDKLSAQRKIDIDFAEIQRNSFNKLQDSVIASVEGLKDLDQGFKDENKEIIRNAKNADQVRSVLEDLIKTRKALAATQGTESRGVAELDLAIQNIKNSFSAQNIEVENAKQIQEEYNRQLQRSVNFQLELLKLRKENPFAAGILAATNELKQEAQGFDEKLGKEMTLGFRDGLRDALGAAISQTDDLNQALQNVATNFLKRMQDLFLQDAANNLTLGIKSGLSKAFSTDSGASAQSGLSSVFKSIGNFFTSGPDTPRAAMLAKGGYIKGYASGGLVTGGSGYKDDVPAMLNAGEYVINKSSVLKYGEENLRKLNSGEVPRFAAGGIFLPGVRGGTAISGYKDLTAFSKQVTTSGATDVLMGSQSTAFANLEDQSARLSRFALLNEDDIVNQEVRSAQEQALNIMAEREAYRTAQRKAFQKQLKQTAISAALNFGIGQLGSALSKTAAVGKGSATGLDLMSQASGKTQFLTNAKPFSMPSAPTFNYSFPPRGAYGGMLNRYSAGGQAKQMPALLMGGEYVINRQTTQKYGKQFFDSINQGRATRLADGGQVSSSEPSFAEKAASATEAKSSGATNVSISINVTGGSAETETQGETKQGGVDYKKMSEQIKQIVIQTINEEKRLGGSLRPRG